MNLGFTGASSGMTNAQITTIADLVNTYNPEYAHHGDCIGSDEIFHHIVRLYAPMCKIAIHPPIRSDHRANCDGDIMMGEYEYLVRNRHIARDCDVLLATPKGYVEELRSGTWATIRYTRKLKKPIHIVAPDGHELEAYA